MFGQLDKYVKKLEEIKNTLSNQFAERENETEGMLLALLSRQHMLMIGPAGTAKSALAAKFAESLAHTAYFQWLLTPFSTPEEVFGPLSLKDLEEGIYKRNTACKMPEAHIAFLDEIFKANSAILNSLLTLLNERLFFNGNLPEIAPLQSVIGASNEFPEEGEGLEALFDRFLLRYEVDFIQEERNFLSMMKHEGPSVKMPSIHLNELAELQELADRIIIGDGIYNILANIRSALQDEGIRPSDRRFKQSLSVIKAKALLHGRQEATLEDLAVLENILWGTPGQKETVQRIIQQYTVNLAGQTLASIENEAEEIYDAAVRDLSIEAGMEALKKLAALQSDVEQLKAAEIQQCESAEIKRLTGKLTAMQREVENSRTGCDYYNVGF